MKRIFQVGALLAVSCVLAVSSWGQRVGGEGSAWEALLAQNPSAADDPTISWRQRLILYALSPGQARSYYESRADASSLFLDSGQTLDEYLEARLSPRANIYVQLPAPCLLFSEQVLWEGESRLLKARGEDLSRQGGSQIGCRIPQEAVSMIVQLTSAAAKPAQLKLWAKDMPEPAQVTFAVSAPASSSMAVVSLCRESCETGEFEIRTTEAVQLEGEVVGYFRPLAATDQPERSGGVLYSTEGSSNNFFGTGAGANNTGTGNSFFGGEAGKANTKGSENSFFGAGSGFGNTTGSDNSFFGQNAGVSNIAGHSNSFFGSQSGFKNTGSSNSFFGRGAGYSNTTGFSNSFFGRSSGQSNSEGVANSFFGKDAGGSNTEGNLNSFFGESAGYWNDVGYGNSFFGRGSGTSNTSGALNSFFGEAAGYYNKIGWSNSFFGRDAGFSNTSGSSNSFFGRDAGRSNTVESENTLIGRRANLDPGPDPAASPVENATALGYRALVSQSNSLVLGSIAGVNLATSYVNVGIGTAAPQEALHVHRSDGTANLLVEETSSSTAARFLFSLVNNGGSRFSFENTNDGRQWFFSLDGNSNFNASLAGTGGAEFLIRKNGRVQMGPGAAWVFDLSPSGDLDIAGDLTANGMFYTSDRNLKENFASVDRQEILRKVSELEITRWNYRDDEVEIPHLGPVAQDFYTAFGLGSDETRINAADISGVSLAAIQGLHKKIQEQMQEKDSEIKKLRQENRELRREIREIHRRLDEMAQSLSAGS